MTQETSIYESEVRSTLGELLIDELSVFSSDVASREVVSEVPMIGTCQKHSPIIGTS
jgi:hypothetical protein